MNDEITREELPSGQDVSDGTPRASGKAGPLRVGAFKQSPEHIEALERVQAWTRARFALPEDATVLVSEISCPLPGCPPLETVVFFWTDSEKRHRFKVFKPAKKVVEDDIPPAWLKDALFATEGSGFDCC